MQKYQVKTAFALMLVCVFIQLSCKENLLEAEQYGEIQGVIQNDEEDRVVKGAGVTTNPPTIATSSDEDGRFKITEVPGGSYTVQVSKQGYKSTSVNIAVREDEIANAIIFLNYGNANNPSSKTANIEITKWQNETSDDSLYVNVDYMIENNGAGNIEEYEIYFKIETAKAVYYQEQQGSQLRSGEINMGKFRKSTQNESAEKVMVNGHWLSPDEGSTDQD
ncbi:MAG: carboxypeptidase-like regulatory domain-containing protein [Balneolales bacterium]